MIPFITAHILYMLLALHVCGCSFLQSHDTRSGVEALYLIAVGYLYIYLLFPFNYPPRGFLNVFSWRVTVFHRPAKLSELNFFIRSILFSRWSNKAGKTIVTASQFAQCLAFNNTPALCCPPPPPHQRILTDWYNYTNLPAGINTCTP